MAPYTRKTSKTNYCKSSEGSEKDTGARGAHEARGAILGVRCSEPAGGCCTHQKPLGEDQVFAAMLSAVYVGPLAIGPWLRTATGLAL